jgi:hypothetical protein
MASDNAGQRPGGYDITLCNAFKCFLFFADGSEK